MTYEEQKLFYKDMKRKFFDGSLEFLPKYAHIIKNWCDSRDAGAKSDLIALPESARDLQVFQRLDEIYRIQLSFYDEYYQDMNRTLASLNCACFYLDERFSVYYKSGSEELLKELKSKGLRIGSNLSVKNIGVFAGNIDVNSPFTNVFTLGESHYSDLLCEYGCAARYGQSLENSKLKSNKIIIFPIKQYSKSLRATIEFILESEETAYKKSTAYPRANWRLRLLERSAAVSNECFLLTDEKGNIAFFNNLFEREFGKRLQSDEVDILSIMPQLEGVKDCLTTGKGFQLREFSLPNYSGKKRPYFVDCLIMKDGSSIIGSKIIFHTDRDIRRAASCVNGKNVAVFTFDDILGESAPISRAKDQAKRAAQSESNIIITGESGTGKELFAQAIHNSSSRASGPFIPINCGAIPKELIGTELFGYKGGAFTGASKTGSPGKIEQADGGTLFLDEIGEMPVDMQTYLLRFLENGVFSRIGGNEYLTSNVRIIAATNRNLQKSIEQGTFRLDLFYRLNVISIVLPPLRDHMEDMELLANYYVNTVAARNNKIIRGIPTQVMRRLSQYNWPGNIRELRNVMERCVVETPNGSNLVLALDDTSVTPSSEIMHLSKAEPIPHYRDYEEQHIRELMVRYSGNKSAVASSLGISRSTLYKKLREMQYEL